jgi:hypothetical protein
LKNYFKLLQQWQKHAHYKFESRIDSYFGYYLTEFIESEFSPNKALLLLPEFPYKNRSQACIDFLYLSKNKTNYFIELKTDVNNHNLKNQLERYLEVNDLKKLIDILSDNYKNTAKKYKDKYKYIIDKMIKCNLISKYPINDKYSINPNHQNKTIEILYLIPKKLESDLTDYKSYINIRMIEKHFLEWFKKKETKSLFDILFYNLIDNIYNN